jgi:hypothetical protein
MKKVIVLLSVFVLILLTSMFFELQTVKAATKQYVSIEVTSGSYNTYVNQRVELTARINDWGTPPYRYQWYTIFMPQDVLDRGFPILPDWRLVKIKVPGANSSIFEFIQSTPGTYNINLQVIDSNGHDAQVSSNFIVVQELPSPSPSPSSASASIPTLQPAVNTGPELPQTEPSLTVLDTVVVVTLMVVIVSTLLYRRHRKTTKNPKAKTV